MSCPWLWLIVNLFISFISLSQSYYRRLPPVNCSELSPIGTSITQLINVLPSSNWEFTFLTRSSVVSYFLLDALKGTITVKHQLDREDLCRLGICSCSNECLLKLEINALRDTDAHIIHVPIIVLDENDNFCFFSNDIYYLNISENVPINTRLVLPLAHDPDQTPNNVQSYSIVPNNYSQFRLDNQLTPSMIITEPLDREIRDKYYFNFCAYEGVENQKRSCCTKIILKISDINDNSPNFQPDQQIPLIIKISELSPIGTELIQMKAFDPDEGLNGQIRYTFSTWTQNDAMDCGSNSIPVYATVIIQVIDENDCTPEIFIFSPNEIQFINNSIIRILENISIDTSILYLTVSDYDSNENGRAAMKLISSFDTTLPVRLEKVTDNTYVLKTNLLFDREQNSFYSFTLLAYDHGQPQRSIDNQFELQLIDVNDCAPIFENSKNDSFYIDENNEENLILYTIEVFDPDEDDQVTLELKFNEEQPYNNIFQLNEKNQLIIVKSLDYEKQSFYEFSILAEDLIGHQTFLSIVIYLNDLNDNPVKFSKNFTQFQLEENQYNYTFLGHIQAEDEDKNDEIIYSIHADDFYRTKDFIELKKNGNLYTKISFDREQISKLKFRIIANDSLHTDLTAIEILILDQNDNRPVIISRSPYCYIYNKTNSNENIRITLEGYDPDENDNGNISFSIINPSSTNIRILSSGTLIVAPLYQEYKFDILLKDHGKSKVLSSIYKKFILLIVSDESECQHYSILSSIQLDQRTFIYFISIILISLACFTLIILIICCFCYFLQRRTKRKSLNNKTTANLTPSFSSSINEDAENDTLLLSSPSPQFTAMTTVSISTTTTNDSTRLTTFTDRIPTNKSSSISSSSSTTYVKMSHSFEDEIL